MTTYPEYPKPFTMKHFALILSIASLIISVIAFICRVTQ